MDTQWPRFEVFVQETPGSPHQGVGSVHASDAELALLNARDVFARRPACVSMWVAPVHAIFSLTREQLSALAEQPEAQPAQDLETKDYYLFVKTKPAGTHVFSGQVIAASPQAAIAQARAAWTGRQQPYVWWAVETSLVLQSDPQDVDSLYAPALDKPFRLSTDFQTVTAMRQIRSTVPELKPPCEDE